MIAMEFIDSHTHWGASVGRHPGQVLAHSFTTIPVSDETVFEPLKTKGLILFKEEI